MLIRSRFILATAWGLALTTASLAAPSPTTRPAVTTGASTAMEVPEVDMSNLPPAAKGKLENEPIRRKTPGGTGKVAPIPSNASKEATAKAPVVPTSTGLDFSRVLISLGVVLVLIFLMRWAGKRFLMGPTAGRSSRAIQVISRTMISPKQHLLLLQVGQRVIVVADSGGTMSSLSEITDPDEVASLVGRIAEEKSVAAGVPTFGGLMGRFKGGYDRSARDAEDAEAMAKQAEPEQSDGESVTAEAESADPALASTQSELQGLMRKVRLLSGNFKTSA